MLRNVVARLDLDVGAAKLRLLHVHVHDLVLKRGKSYGLQHLTDVVADAHRRDADGVLLVVGLHDDFSNSLDQRVEAERVSDEVNKVRRDRLRDLLLRDVEHSLRSHRHKVCTSNCTTKREEVRVVRRLDVREHVLITELVLRIKVVVVHRPRLELRITNNDGERSTVLAELVRLHVERGIWDVVVEERVEDLKPVIGHVRTKSTNRG